MPRPRTPMPRTRRARTGTTSAASGAHPSRAAHDVLVTGELLDPDRPAGVKTVGGDADLRAHAELTAVGELGGRVMQHDCAVDALQEALGGGAVLGDDRFGVRG